MYEVSSSIRAGFIDDNYVGEFPAQYIPASEIPTAIASQLYGNELLYVPEDESLDSNSTNGYSGHSKTRAITIFAKDHMGDIFTSGVLVGVAGAILIFEHNKGKTE